MTYKAIIKKLVDEHNVHIKYHFNIYPTQRRLIIDQVEEKYYNNTPDKQNMARTHIKELEVKYGKKDEQKQI